MFVSRIFTFYVNENELGMMAEPFSIWDICGSSMVLRKDKRISRDKPKTKRAEITQI